MPSRIPFYCTANAKEIVPEPKVAAISEKIDPLVPPALNFLCTYRVGESSCKGINILGVLVKLAGKLWIKRRS